MDNELIEKLNEMDHRYDVNDFLGSGAYGTVCGVVDRDTKEKYALKMCRDVFASRTLAKRSLREIRILRLISHPCIVTLKKVFATSQMKDVFLLFELMDTDLAQIIKSPQKLGVDHVQYFLLQLLSAVNHLHKLNIIHRDIKPRNILVNADCTLKLADFGLARVFHDGMDETSTSITDYVTTRWYRAPEILAGWTRYGTAVDMWAVGCILAELFNRKPLFPGNDTLRQLEKIIFVLGKPPTTFLERCYKFAQKQFMHALPTLERKSLSHYVNNIPKDALDLIAQLLIFDPYLRLDADECLRHPFLVYVPREQFESKTVQVSIPRSAFEHEGPGMDCERVKVEIVKEMALYYEDVEQDHLDDLSSVYTDALQSTSEETIVLCYNTNHKSIEQSHKGTSGKAATQQTARHQQQPSFTGVEAIHDYSPTAVHCSKTVHHRPKDIIEEQSDEEEDDRHPSQRLTRLLSQETIVEDYYQPIPTNDPAPFEEVVIGCSITSATTRAESSTFRTSPQQERPDSSPTTLAEMNRSTKQAHYEQRKMSKSGRSGHMPSTKSVKSAYSSSKGSNRISMEWCGVAGEDDLPRKHSKAHSNSICIIS